MDELGIPGKLKDERLGHEDGSVGARYSHVTSGMRVALLDAFTEAWENALEVRRRMVSGSPGRPAQAALTTANPKIVSPDAPERLLA